MFNQKQSSITEVVNAGKEKITGEEAWALLKNADKVIIGRGKKFSEFNPAVDDKEEILKQALGRTGNLRAPCLKIGTTLVIGFNDAMYTDYIS